MSGKDLWQNATDEQKEIALLRCGSSPKDVNYYALKYWTEFLPSEQRCLENALKELNVSDEHREGNY